MADAPGDTWIQRALRWPWTHAPALTLLAVWAVLALSAARTKCTTFDEVAHLTGGYSYWLTNDYRLHPENGNLPQRWAALPLLLDHTLFPSLEQPAWQQSNVWMIGRQFFYDSGNDPDALLLRGRAMIALFGVALGLLVYFWSARLFGRAGGLVSLVLFAFCPTTLAHGALATSDLAAALFFTASAGCLWNVLHRVTPLTLLGSSLVMAGLFLAKMSGVLILPMGLALILVRLLDPAPLEVSFGRPRQAGRLGGRLPKLLVFAGITLVHAAIVWGAIWAAYGFRYSAFRGTEQAGVDAESWQYVLRSPGVVTSAVRLARDQRLLPEAYLYGFQFNWATAHSRSAFLNGEHRVGGWPQFFPYCLLVKTPLPLFVLLALAATAVVSRWRAEDPMGQSRWVQLGRGLYQTAPLWVLLAVYWMFAVTSKLNIGHRHILPTYPPMYILAGAAAFWLQRTTRAFRLTHPIMGGLALVALLLFMAESLSSWPNYLSYFNQVVGGPRNGYRHLVDSSLDWGQDLPGLKKWLDRRGLNDPEQTPVYLAYFGTGSPEHYGIRAIPLPRPPERSALRPGVYCISATTLQGVHFRPPGPWRKEQEEAYQDLRVQVENDPAAPEGLLREVEALRLARLCAFLRQREPTDQVGYSILIYELSEADIERAQFGPPPYGTR